MNRVYIAGIGMTQFGKSPKTLVELLCDAATRALSATNVNDVEAIYIGSMNPEEFTGESNLASRVAEGLNMNGIPAIRVETASSAGAAAFSAGFFAVVSGCYRCVLVLGGEKMTQLSTSATTRIVAEALDSQERHCGATLPALAAMVTEKYRTHYHLSQSRLERVLYDVATKNHLNGSRNAYAQFRNAISREQYFSSKFVATPLRLYDCAPITDGAAAVVLTSEATDMVVSGISQATAPVSLRARESLISFPATQIAARKAYAMAGCAAQGIDFAEVHDAFTPFEIISSEDLGFFPAGKGGDAVESGETRVDGMMPINASGGLKARGHPIGASGVAQVCESVRLLRGVSGVKLKREPRRGLAQSTGALATNNFVTILERVTPESQVQNLWQSPAYPKAQPVRRETRASAPIGTQGKIETFTILHTTAEGFLPPLALALIRDRNGSLVMARGEDTRDLKIAREVYLREAGGIYVFRVRSYLRQVRQAMRHLLTRATG